MNPKEKSKYKEAGNIAKQTADYAKTIIKPEMKLLDIAEKIEKKIVELGAKPAFPISLSINDVAAHYTPSTVDETEAEGLLKVDIGVHIDGYIADTAFTIDLEKSSENKNLIKAAESALKEAIKTAKLEIPLNKIGDAIQNKISEAGFSPIRNLSGHELGHHNVHAGLTIPNHDNNNTIKLHEGAYAIEPFTTTGQGMVYEGKPSGIYKLQERKPVRDAQARKILNYIEDNYKTLPFCSRWIVKEFGKRALISLNFLEKAEAISQFPQLIEKSHAKVAQAEHTIIVGKKTIQLT